MIPLLGDSMRRLIPLFPRTQVWKKLWLAVGLFNVDYGFSTTPTIIARCVHEWQPVIIVNVTRVKALVDQGLCALVGENKGPIISTGREGDRPSRRYRVSPGLAFPNTNYPSRKPSYLPIMNKMPDHCPQQAVGRGLDWERKSGSPYSP